MASGALAALGVPRLAQAEVSAADRRFLFVLCGGGWDPSMVFAPGSDDGVDRESDATTASAGGLSWVSNPSRPGVDAFFQTWHDRALVFNGLEVRNVDHTICTHLAKTGDTGGDRPDWATILGQDRAGDFVIPHLALGGPAFAGTFSTALVRVSSGDAISDMLGGNVLNYSETTVPRFDSRSLLDDFAKGRAQELAADASGRRAGLLADFDASLDVMAQAEPYRESLQGSSSLAVQVDNAVEVLRLGLSRCVSLSQTYNGYDTHTSNTWYQDYYLKDLFAALDQLMTALATTPGHVGETLLDETTVVVQSEMGKTPQLNSGGGKDHWPFTSALLLGSGFTGDRVVGAYADGLMGRRIDLATGDVDDDGVALTATSIGATVLALGDVDPGAWDLDAEPVMGVL